MCWSFSSTPASAASPPARPPVWGQAHGSRLRAEQVTHTPEAWPPSGRTGTQSSKGSSPMPDSLPHRCRSPPAPSAPRRGTRGPQQCGAAPPRAMPQRGLERHYLLLQVPASLDGHRLQYGRGERNKCKLFRCRFYFVVLSTIPAILGVPKHRSLGAGQRCARRDGGGSTCNSVAIGRWGRGGPPLLTHPSPQPASPLPLPGDLEHLGSVLTSSRGSPWIFPAN